MSQTVNILFSGRIEPHAMEMLCKTILDELNEEDTLNLLIHSAGGDASLAMGIAMFIEQLPCRVISYNMGSTDSAAILLFAAGSQRLASPFSRFLTHPLSIEPRQEPCTLDELRGLVFRLEQETKHLTEYLAYRTGTSATQWRRLMETSASINVKQAKQLGLIHGIAVQPPDKAARRFFIH